VDAVVLLQYFGSRQQRELGKILEISTQTETETQTQTGSNQMDIRTTQEGEDPQPKKVKGKKCLNVRIVHNLRSGEHYIEVTGSTYPVKEDLRDVFGFDYYYIKSGSGYWLKYYDSDREMECVLADLASLAAREKMNYKYKGSINISHHREHALQSPDHDHKESSKTIVRENEQLTANAAVTLQGEEKYAKTESDEPVKSASAKKKGPIAKFFSMFVRKKIK
jgi:hypothetical protein